MSPDPFSAPTEYNGGSRVGHARLASCVVDHCSRFKTRISFTMMADEEEETVKKVIKKLRDYLQKYLSIDENFIRGLQARKLLSERDSSHFCATLSKGGNDALYSFLDHVSAFYVEETLETFCTFLDDYSKSEVRPRLGRIAAKIRDEMKKHRPGAMEQADTQQDGDLVPTVSGGEPVFTIDKRSQKIEEIVDLYRRGGNKFSLPRIPELEDDFDCIIEAVSSQLSSADPQVICKLHGIMRVKYGRYIHGVKPVELPSVPNTANGLCEFITEKSTPYEILLVHHTVEALNCEDLKTTLQSYESKLADHLRLTLGSYKKRKVALPLRKDHTHLAVTISKDQILLSLTLHIKEYLMKYLQLEDAVFEGFGEGCTVLFFSILRIDAVFLAPKILSHSAELKRSFDITHLVVFDYFACDLERATIELPVTSESFERQILMRDLKEEMLHQFDQLQTSKAAHDRRQVVAVFEKVQQELTSTKKKLDVVEEGFVEAEKMLRTSTVSWSEDKVDATSLRNEPVLQIKDLKEEMLHQFEQLQTSKVNEDAMKYEHLQNEAMALKMKLKEEEMLRKKAEEEQRRIAGELVKMEKKWSESGSKSYAIPKKVISDVEGLLGQSSEPVEGLQDKSKMLLEEWPKLSEHERSLQLSVGGTTECEDELFALAYKDGVEEKYICHVYEKSEDHYTPRYITTQLHMVITYSTIHWSQIVQKYCTPDGKDWKLRTVIKDFTVEGDVITVNMPEDSGANWTCTCDGINMVPTSSLDFTKKFPPVKDGPKLLEQAVKSSFYPPKLTLITSSNIHDYASKYNRSRFICLGIAGSSPGIRIPVQVFDRVEPEMERDSSSSAEDRDSSPHDSLMPPPMVVEKYFSSPSTETVKHPSPTVKASGMTKTPLKTEVATILSVSSKEKEQQAN